MATPIILTPRPPSIDAAMSVHGQGRLDEAEQIYAAILAGNPEHFDALHLLGLVRHQQGREVEALRLISSALKSKPNSPDALSNLGLVLDALERHQEALETFDQALSLMSDHVNALGNRGLTLAALGRTDEALESWGRALAINPNHAPALHSRGNALYRLKRHAEALADYERLLSVKPGNPDVFNNLGNVLSELGRPEEAMASYDRALALDPDLPEVLINKGHIFADLHRFDEAFSIYGAAAAFESKRAEAIFCQSLVRLRLGQFAPGWRDYEWRWRQSSWGERARHFTAPLWLGAESLAGKTILLHSEQGFGDTLNFVRFAPLAERLGAKVVLEVQPPLKPLLAGFGGASQILARGEPLPAFDLHCPLMSLPLALGTDLGSIPAEIPYLDVPADRVARWRGRLGEKRRPRVGFAWAGSPVHERNGARSLTLERFAAMLAVADVDFVSLQKEMTAVEAAALRAVEARSAEASSSIIALGAELGDFADTAAVIAELDLVVSVDTSVVHLAGALGKPVWVLLPFLTDFRWLLDRDDSPWYPSARLFRQPRYGDWTSVFERVRGEIEIFVTRMRSDRQGGLR